MRERMREKLIEEEEVSGGRRERWKASSLSVRAD